MDFEHEVPSELQTGPDFLAKTNKLAKALKELKTSDISKLMKLSPALSELNYNRFQTFKSIKSPSTAKQAAFAFNGDTYTGLDIKSFNQTDLKNAQKRLRILSGLYGILRPMDLIQPYRLEMGTKFKFDDYKNLYDYWKSDVTKSVNEELKKYKILVNCASNEYFSVIDKNELKGEIITPVFKEERNGQLKIISFSAKKARGMFAKYIIKNKIKTIDELKDFSEENY